MKVNNGHVFVPVSFSGTLFGSDRWEGTERVQLYADEGYGVQVEYWRTSRTGDLQCAVQHHRPPGEL